MTIPATLPVTFSAVKTEFSPDNPASPLTNNLLSYIKNNTSSNLVATSPTTTGIPTGVPFPLKAFAPSARGNSSTKTYTTAGTETIPVGVQQMVIEMWGGGGGGGSALYTQLNPTVGVSGGGGGGSGYIKATIPVIGPQWGKTLAITVNPGSGAGGTWPGAVAASTSGTAGAPWTVAAGPVNGFPLPAGTMTAGGGSGGGPVAGAGPGGTNTIASPNGTITANTPGFAGGAGGPGPGPRIGGTAGPGVTSPTGTFGAGGAGGPVMLAPATVPGSSGAAGGAGRVIFTYT